MRKVNVSGVLSSLVSQAKEKKDRAPDRRLGCYRKQELKNELPFRHLLQCKTNPNVYIYFKFFFGAFLLNSAATAVLR